MREPRSTDPLSVANALEARLEKLGSVKDTFATKLALSQTKGTLPQLDQSAVLGISRSMNVITENQKRLQLLGASSPLMTFKANNVLLPDLSRSIFALKTSPVMDAMYGLNKFKTDITAVSLMAGGVGAFPASELVAQLPRHPLAWTSQKFAVAPLRVVGLSPALPRLHELETLKLGLLMPVIRPGWDAPFKTIKEFDALSKRWLDEAIAEAEREWERDPLGFILSPLPQNCRRMLAFLDPEQVEEGILLALEQVITRSEFIASLSEALGDARQLKPYQLENLRHGLELAEEGKYVTAIPSLLTGLEGSIHREAEETGLIDAGRQLVGKPRGKGRANTRHIISEMELEPLLGRLTHKRVLHTTGQNFRHGVSDGSERRQVLLTIVAVSGWTDRLTGHSTCADLICRISEELPTAIEHLEGLAVR